MLLFPELDVPLSRIICPCRCNVSMSIKSNLGLASGALGAQMETRRNGYGNHIRRRGKAPQSAVVVLVVVELGVATGMVVEVLSTTPLAR